MTPITLPRPTTLADDLRELVMLAAGVIGFGLFMGAVGACTVILEVLL